MVQSINLKKTKVMSNLNIGGTISPKTDQLNADDLVAGSKTITIRDIKVIDSEIQPVSIYFDGDNNKPYKPSKGMRRLLVQLWGEDEKVFIGRKITLFRDDEVKFGGDEVGGIRISHVSNIDAPTKVLVTVSKSKRRPITILPIIEQKKKVMTDLDAAKKAIADGTVTLEKIQAQYELTDEQIKTLQS